MNIFYNQKSKEYDPRYEIFDGEIVEHADKPGRVDSIFEQVSKTTNNFIEAKSSNNLELISQIHSKEYLDFLISLKETLNHRLFPSIWNYSNYINNRPDRVQINCSNFCFDTLTPFSSGIFDLATESVSTAIQAANSSIQNQNTTYSLCRPSGHHALKDMAGGYCYLANASIVAQHALNLGLKPCILDIDFHHGNGAQEIWYDSEKVLTLSIHRANKFPYFTGFENEIGVGEGNGWNKNFTFDQGVLEAEYCNLLGNAINEIKGKDVNFLIISAGFDTYKNDPICDGGLEISSYAKIAKIISSLNIPTVILQEGGYHIADLGKCVDSFLSGFNQ
jgi:acetoin utilization deacetylase AcuC-like enzyme